MKKSRLLLILAVTSGLVAVLWSSAQKKAPPSSKQGINALDSELASHGIILLKTNQPPPIPKEGLDKPIELYWLSSLEAKNER